MRQGCRDGKRKEQTEGGREVRREGGEGRRPGADRWRGEWREGRKERQIDR